jgi:FHS family L-fucose permease-like MFS transporter
LIASKYFFSDEHSDDLTNVQWVYLAVALMGVIVAVAFFFTKLPEPSEESLQAEAEALALAQGVDTQADKPFRKQYRAISGAVAQFLYVGAQVACGAHFLFRTEEAGIHNEEGAKLLSYALIIFTVARFIGTALLSFISAPVLLFAHAIFCTILLILVGSIKGFASIVCLMLVFYGMSIMYPVIFVLGTSGLGRHTRRASGLLVMGVSGGACFPAMQGAVGDRFDTRVSFFLLVPCFVYIALWALWVWNADGRQWKVGGRELEREVEAAAGGAIPPAHVGLNYTGEKESYEPSIKEDVERVEKA